MDTQGIATDKNILVLYSNANYPGKKDATGAFIPEAKKFSEIHGVPEENRVGLKLVNVSKKLRRERTLDAIYETGGQERWDAIAFFGHGWPKGIQFGFNRDHIPELCEVLADCCNPDAKIILFACLAAENDVRDKEYGAVGPGTDGGFADLLRDEMVWYGLKKGWVDAHKTAGHTAWNPFVVRFLCSAVEDPLFGAVGGHWLVAPGSQQWKQWVKKLRTTLTGLRYRFPFMTEFEIMSELVGHI